MAAVVASRRQRPLLTSSAWSSRQSRRALPPPVDPPSGGEVLDWGGVDEEGLACGVGRRGRGWGALGGVGRGGLPLFALRPHRWRRLRTRKSGRKSRGTLRWRCRRLGNPGSHAGCNDQRRWRRRFHRSPRPPAGRLASASFGSRLWGPPATAPATAVATRAVAPGRGGRSGGGVASRRRGQRACCAQHLEECCNHRCRGRRGGPVDVVGGCGQRGGRLGGSVRG